MNWETFLSLLMFCCTVFTPFFIYDLIKKENEKKQLKKELNSAELRSNLNNFMVKVLKGEIYKLNKKIRRYQRRLWR